MFKDLRRDTKRMHDSTEKEKSSMQNESSTWFYPKRFWSYYTTNQKSVIIFLRNGQSFITNSYTKANLLNKFFHSVFAAENDLNPLYFSRSCIPPIYLNNI